MNIPRCRVVAASQRCRSVAMRSLSFDGSDLIIELQGEAFVYLRLVFRYVEGFRVLDEGKLGKFWKDYTDVNGWLYEVETGGWLELEAHRNSLLTLNPPEFFLIGGDPERAWPS